MSTKQKSNTKEDTDGLTKSGRVIRGALHYVSKFFFFQAEDGIRDADVTGVQTCALPISIPKAAAAFGIGAGLAALRTRYLPSLVRKRASNPATRSSRTRSSEPNEFSRSLSTFRKPTSRPAIFIAMMIFFRVPAAANCAGCRSDASCKSAGDAFGSRVR